MTWLSHNWQQVLDLLLRHTLLAVPAVALSVVVALVVGRLAYRSPRLGGAVLTLASLLYAVPALPMLIVIPVLLGLPLRSDATLVVALAVYGTAMLVGTATDAFRAVDDGVREAAVAMGYSPRGLLWRVDLPLAVPVLLSGVRVTTVSTVALVTIGALVGIPSLGTLLTDGFQRGIDAEVLTGVVATMALALVLDGLLVALGAVLTPWERDRSGRDARSPRRGRRSSYLGSSEVVV